MVVSVSHKLYLTYLFIIHSYLTSPHKYQSRIRFNILFSAPNPLLLNSRFHTPGLLDGLQSNVSFMLSISVFAYKDFEFIHSTFSYCDGILWNSDYNYILHHLQISLWKSMSETPWLSASSLSNPLIIQVSLWNQWPQSRMFCWLLYG